MEILFNKKGLDWDRFVIENSGSFLQSWGWGEFQQALGRKFWRIKGNNILAALIVKYPLPFGKSYLYCPGGPVIKSEAGSLELEVGDFLRQVEEIAMREGAIFLKVEPLGYISGDWIDVWRNCGFNGSSGVQRLRKTLILDLVKSEEKLLAEMGQKTRYNIKLAQKNNVEIKISVSPKEDFENIWDLFQQTEKRNKIRMHPRNYYLKQLESGFKDELSEIKSRTDEQMETKLFLAEHDDKVVAANIAVFFGKTAVYLHGASDYQHRNLMAPHLLQWAQIGEAKRRGCEIYDFWGIDEKKWPGVTRFKKGFGGKEIEYCGAWDYVFDKNWYWIYKTARKLTQMLKLKTQNHN